MGIETVLASALINLVTADVYNILKKEILLVWKVDGTFKDLQAACMNIEAMLCKLNRSQMITTPTLELWLEDLENHWYEMEDLVHELLIHLASVHAEKRGEKPVRASIFNSGKLKIPHKMNELLKKSNALKQRIESILEGGAIHMVQPQDIATRYQSSLLDRTLFVPGACRKKDKEAIIKGLMFSDDQRFHHGVSIIGMDGLGKTSLAASIARTIQEANPNGLLILFAHVSDDFKLKHVVDMLDIQHSCSDTAHETQPSHIELLKYLLKTHQKSLIVLDDLWSVTCEDWDKFTSNYLSLSPCWRILTTTRNPKVAKLTRTTAYYLDIVSNEDCAELIKEKGNLPRFDGRIWTADVQKIAEKCEGMPIIANKIGLILSKEQREDELKSTLIQYKENELKEQPEFQQVFTYLNLKETVLPPDLQRCFAYCSLFPSGQLFNRDDLIQLWEAAGFIQFQRKISPKQSNQPFEDLLSRSVFQPSNPEQNKHPLYKMHKFNHEFAHLLASNAFCRLDDGSLSPCKNIRHLSLNHENTDKELVKAIQQCIGLRTFLLLQQGKPKTRKFPDSFYDKLERLILLDMSHTTIEDLSKANLPKHLRYLDLSNTNVKKLPKSISCLVSLKVLKLKDCSRLRELPKDLNKLISLTHLYVNMEKLYRVPPNMGELTRLEVLGSFAVGKDTGHKIMELGTMELLREIRITGLENIEEREEAVKANLSSKSRLSKLTLEWGSDEQMLNADAVLEDLRPHNNLHVLELINYGGQSFPNWLTSPSCLLVSIFLNGCNSCPRLPSLGHLPLLKNLVLHSISKVEDLDDLFYGEHGSESERGGVFPCLESLELRFMEELVSWKVLKANDMPLLGALKLESCGMLVNLPSFKHLSCFIKLDIKYCSKLPSLPELPSSLNGEFGKLTIEGCELVSARCHVGGDDWPKIKDIPEGSRIIFPSPRNEQDDVSMDELQPLVTVHENNVQQVKICEVSTTVVPPPKNVLSVENLKLKVRSPRGRDGNHGQVSKTVGSPVSLPEDVGNGNGLKRTEQKKSIRNKHLDLPKLFGFLKSRLKKNP